MTDAHLLEEAEQCRRQALAYVGQPEATFLLNAAREFERLAQHRGWANESDEPSVLYRGEPDIREQSKL